MLSLATEANSISWPGAVVIIAVLLFCLAALWVVFRR